jgi:hypothetical protein
LKSHQIINNEVSIKKEQPVKRLIALDLFWEFMVVGATKRFAPPTYAPSIHTQKKYGLKKSNHYIYYNTSLNFLQVHLMNKSFLNI